jgi:hypothetical protein
MIALNDTPPKAHFGEEAGALYCTAIITLMEFADVSGCPGDVDVIEWFVRKREEYFAGRRPAGRHQALPVVSPAARTALDELVSAVEAAMAGPSCATEPDDEDVSLPPSGITFGMIRRARAAIS